MKLFVSRKFKLTQLFEVTTHKLYTSHDTIILQE